MDGTSSFFVRLRIIFSRVRLWQIGDPLSIERHTPIWQSNNYFGTVDAYAMGLDQVTWTMEHLVTPSPIVGQAYSYFGLMRDMVRQVSNPEVGQIIQYVVQRADFHDIPHFRSFEGRMLRYSVVDDSIWQVDPLQPLPIGRLVPAEHEPLPFDHRIDCEITVATWWRLLQDLPLPFERTNMLGCYSEFSTLGSEHDVSSGALPHSTESSDFDAPHEASEDDNEDGH